MDKKSEIKKWAKHAIVYGREYFGNERRNLRKLITERSNGRVLEAMSGCSSHFDNSDNIKEVIALDYCKEALDRYEFPERTRVIFDLEGVSKGKKLCFDDASFQTIGVSLGIQYISDDSLFPLLKEFHRILSDNGKLLIFGKPDTNYEKMAKRKFIPNS